MFGMLDYRAARLYMLFSVPLSFIGFWMVVLLAPLFSIAILNFFTQNKMIFVISSIPMYIILSFLITLIFIFFRWVLRGIFYYVIDVIPTNERSSVEARFVAENGQFGISFLKLQKNPQTWHDEDIECVASFGTGRLFKNTRIERFKNIRQHWIENNLDYIPTELIQIEFLKKNGSSPPIFELIITNHLYLNYLFGTVVLAIALFLIFPNYG